MKATCLKGRHAGAWLYVVLSIAFSSLAYGGTAHAQALRSPTAPFVCVDKNKKAAKYDDGLAIGTQRADNFFASTEVAKNPRKLQNKLNRALERLNELLIQAWSAETRPARRCKVQGIVDGYLFRLATLLGQCILDGGQWGQFAAELYCDLSVELGGLGDVGQFIRPAAGLCGTLFEASCDSVYLYVATEGHEPIPPIVKSFLDQRGVTPQPYPGCFPFTQGAFESTFDNALSLDCAYEAVQ